MGRSSRPPLGSVGLGFTVAGAPGADPDYVMQLLNDVRRFADVLLSLKETCHSKGESVPKWPPIPYLVHNFEPNGNL